MQQKGMCIVSAAAPTYRKHPCCGHGRGEGSQQGERGRRLRCECVCPPYPLPALCGYARRAVAGTQRIAIFPGAARAVRRKPTGKLRGAYLIRGCGFGENRKAIPGFGSLPAPAAHFAGGRVRKYGGQYTYRL